MPVNLAWSQQQRHVSAPRRLIAVAREICLLQGRFDSNRKKHIHFVFNHSRFRAAYDFLCLRAASGLADSMQADWWTRFQETDGTGRRQMLRERNRKPTKPKLIFPSPISAEGWVAMSAIAILAMRNARSHSDQGKRGFVHPPYDSLHTRLQCYKRRRR